MMHLLITALGRLRQEDHKLKANLGNREILSQKQNKSKT